MSKLVFKKQVGGFWACTAAPIEIYAVKVSGEVSSYSAFVRGKYVGGGRLLAEAKARGVEAWKGSAS